MCSLIDRALRVDRFVYSNWSEKTSILLITQERSWLLVVHDGEDWLSFDDTWNRQPSAGSGHRMVENGGQRRVGCSSRDHRTYIESSLARPDGR